jgi:hypothetical protein
MGRNSRLVSKFLDGLDAVQKTFPRGPEFYFGDEPKKLHPLPIITFNGWFGWGPSSQNFKISK